MAINISQEHADEDYTPDPEKRGQSFFLEEIWEIPCQIRLEKDTTNTK